MSDANGEIDIGYREIGSELNATIWSDGFSETFRETIVIKDQPIGRRKRQVDYGNYYEPVNSGIRKWKFKMFKFLQNCELSL